ncbi:MAG: (d)CMP kinase [Nanoarchaeota archaeon]|nr:(d)CMP kinase [Nanoarchaeota archaeon]
MIITISGNPGSGKSTVAKILVEKLRLKRVYAGGIMRELALDRGLTLEEFMASLAKDQKLEKDIDGKVVERARELEGQGNNVIAEGRPQFHLIPESVKIFVKVNPVEGAKRIWKDLQDKETSAERNQKQANSVEEVMILSAKRDTTDAERYMKLYGIDHRDESKYDFVVDSSEIDAQQVAQKVIEFLKNKEENL